MLIPMIVDNNFFSKLPTLYQYVKFAQNQLQKAFETAEVY